jgi:hypothetical protein
MLDDACLILAGAGYSEAKKAAVRQHIAARRGVASVPEFEWEPARRSNIYRTSSWDDIRTLEELLEAAFLTDLDDAAKTAAAAFDAIAAAGTTARIPQALDAFEKAMRAAFTTDTESLIRATVNRLINKGALVAGLEQGLRDTLSKNDVIDGMIDNAKFATNEHFSRAVLPDIYGKLDDLYALNQSPTATMTAVRELALDGIDREDYRLRITANGAASRSYHYGVVKGGWDAGFRLFRFTAVLDERTSEVCENMNGKTFSVASAVNVVERRATGGAEDLKEVSPWFTKGQVEGKTDQEIEAIGCLIPPLHANCRSSITLTN